MKRTLSISVSLSLILLLALASIVGAGAYPTFTTLDDAPFPDYNYTRANKLPLTGYFEKSFDVNGVKRTAKIYISPNAPIRTFFTLIAVPDGVDTTEFLTKSGWKDIADKNEEALLVFEPGKAGWGKPEDEQAYLNAVITFYKSNRYFSIFGENYLVGYGRAGAALEAWSAANPLFVTSQVFVDSESLSKEFYAQFGSKFFDGKYAGYTAIEIPKEIAIAYNEVPVPTWFINEDLSKVAESVKYWKGANDCVDYSVVKSNYLYGSAVFPQSETSDAWQTDYTGPISKVATLQTKAAILDPSFSKTVYGFLTEYVRYDNTSAYGNQLAIRKPYGEIHTMMVNGFLREYMVYVPESAAKLWPNGAPVLFVFAGNSQTDKVYWYATMWWKVADDEGVILVIPCEQYSSNSTVVSHKDTDMFYEQLALMVKKYYNVDPTRFYATGQSAGSMAAMGFAITNPEYFAAIASTSGLASPGGTGMGTVPAERAKNKMVPVYAIIGEGDIADFTGTLWDDKQNGLDKWAAYHLNANGLELGDGSNVEVNGRFTTYTWLNEQGFPVMKLGRTAYRAHNNIMAESPMLWDYLEHWSIKDGIRYYSVTVPVPVIEK
ncbi:MAG TPA: alpha/beta hydrolase-fold protein [Bacillota bacterium]|nr:alpha/beta hydrolase-fold protein [Bacillota bacterium]